LCRIVKNNNYSLATRDLKKKVNEFLQHNNIEDQFSYKEVIKKGIRFIKKYNLGHIEQDILLITNKDELDYYAGKIV
jgi:hypothetical protein